MRRFEHVLADVCPVPGCKLPRTQKLPEPLEYRPARELLEEHSRHADSWEMITMQRRKPGVAKGNGDGGSGLAP